MADKIKTFCIVLGTILLAVMVSATLAKHGEPSSAWAWGVPMEVRCK